MKLSAPSAPIASSPSSTRRETSLLICPEGGLSPVEVSSAGRSDGAQGLPYPRTQDLLIHIPAVPWFSEAVRISSN